MLLPDTGDIAWVELDPVKGTEQAGRRPGLILTTRGYHERTGRAVLCPISTAERAWAFNVMLPEGFKVRGAVLVDQIRTVDRSHRVYDIIDRAPSEVMEEVRAKLVALLGIDLGTSARGPEGM